MQICRWLSQLQLNHLAAAMNGDSNESEFAYARLKLEVPNGGNSDIPPRHALNQAKLLEQCLEKHYISIESCLKTVLEEPCCEPFRVFNYEVSYLGCD
ncbi:hypothetical protein COOONC_28164 [Cooperia oncophora]